MPPASESSQAVVRKGHEGAPIWITQKKKLDNILTELGHVLRITEHPFEIDLFFAVRTRLFLPHDTPTPNTKLMEHMFTR